MKDRETLLDVIDRLRGVAAEAGKRREDAGERLLLTLENGARFAFVAELEDEHMAEFLQACREGHEADRLVGEAWKRLQEIADRNPITADEALEAYWTHGKEDALLSEGSIAGCVVEAALRDGRAVEGKWEGVRQAISQRCEAQAGRAMQ